jgi:hypothetical protein
MKHRSAWLMVSSAALLTATFWGCGDDTTGSGGTGGEATTNTTVGTTATKTTGVTVGSTSTGNMVEYVGLECSSDATCGPMGKCILPTANDPIIGDGGPANGYCTIACMASDECPGNGICFVAEEGQEGECFLGCSIGPDLGSLDEELDEDKCHGREDVRCQDYGDTGQACIPTCGSDSQCPAGRVCDPRLAICVDTPNTGEDIGFKCEFMADPTECAGVCVSFGDPITMCSNRCVLGGALEGDDCGGLSRGICAFSPSGYGAGDAGFCSPACNFHSDCQNPDFWCFDVGLPDNGYCFGGETDCPNGQADCEAGFECMQTAFGPKCLDELFPLDEGTGGGGGGTGGGGTGGGGGAGGN